mmetsp:Transcript_14792/g.26561  ORF Transcript_14792/g.26561 Transcript_14792/m.26561 type:complete len:109 (+) Transcript_14792:700-1026(+)
MELNFGSGIYYFYSLLYVIFMQHERSNKYIGRLSLQSSSPVLSHRCLSVVTHSLSPSCCGCGLGAKLATRGVHKEAIDSHDNVSLRPVMDENKHQSRQEMSKTELRCV